MFFLILLYYIYYKYQTKHHQVYSSGIYDMMTDVTDLWDSLILVNISGLYEMDNYSAHLIPYIYIEIEFIRLI